MRSRLEQLCAFILILAFSPEALARQLYFAYAESYYDQLYCELQVKGEGKKLPNLYQL
jgi:hypothetical protein